LKLTKSYGELLKEIEALQFRLEEATDTIDAIRMGNIDGLIVQTQEGTQLYTLRNADQTFRIFIEQMNEGAITLSHEGIILYSNSRFASMMGLPLERVIGQSFFLFVMPDFKLRWKALMSIGWKENIKDEIELHGNGIAVPVLLSLKMLELEEGLSLGVVVTDLSSQKETERMLTRKNGELEHAQNETQHLNATLESTVQQRTIELKQRTEELERNIIQKSVIEKQLRSNEEHLQLMLETMAEGVGIFDGEGKMTYANPMARKILRLAEEELYDYTQGQHLKVDGKPLDYKEHPIAATLLTGNLIFDYEVAFSSEGNGMTYISINAAPLRDNGAAIVGCIVTFMDVTHRRKDILQKDEFISIASHELKTPITSLKASLQFMNQLKDEPFSPVYGEMLGMANRSVDRVCLLVEDLLNATRMKEGQINLRKEHFSLSEVIAEIIPRIMTNAKQKVLIFCDTGFQVFADRNKMEQVVVNLINNAVKYAAASEEIIIKIEQIAGMAKVSVMDKGPGIPPNKLPHLFDRFFRVDFTGNHYSGLGLGLYISSQIVKKHDGEMGVESDLGKGSCFWFTIPM
jgi:two-component system phosphate regulon sensor histidine kinase PhoR